jgi:heme exporter protein B
VAVLLSLVMSLESVFRTDIQEGSLEQFVLSPYPLSMLMFAKSMAHCVAMGLPLLLLAPIFSLTLHLDAMGIIVLWITLSLGIPTISLVGSIAAALTIGLQRGGLLLAIITLPLIMPIVIFGASGVRAASLGLPFYSEILFLAAFLFLALVLGPVAVAAAVRVSLD